MLGIKDSSGRWLQVDATIAPHVDTFGHMRMARTFNNHKAAAQIKTRLEHVGFSELEIEVCNPADDNPADNDIAGLIEE